MSLINDALKRATQAQPAATPAPACKPEKEMEPAPPHRAVGIPGYFTPVLLFVVCGACWFLAKGWDGTRQTGLAKLIKPEPIVAQAREIQEDLPPAEGAELPIPANRQFALNDTPTPSEIAQPQPQPIQVAEAARVKDPSVLTVSAREVPSATRFKLQGIFYRPSSPSAVINAKTVFVGDIVADAKVKAIDQSSVTLDLGSETKVLTLR